MAALLPWIRQQFTDDNNDPLAGGKIFTYIAGTTTPKAVYQDHLGLIAHTNPVILDANGMTEIWLRPGSYKFVITDADEVEIDVIDNIKPADGGGGGIVDEDYNFNIWSERFDEAFVSTGLMDTLTKILIPGYVEPTISLSASGNSVREKGNAVTATTLTAAIQKKSTNISEVRFYDVTDGNTLLDTQTSGGAIPSGGNSTYNWTGSFSDNHTFRAEADDTVDGEGNGPTTVSSTTTFSFIFAWYGGVGAPGLNGAAVGSLAKTIASPSANQRVDYTLAVGEVPYFAYPATIAALNQITDENGFDATSSFTERSLSITNAYGESATYRVYERNTPAGVNNSTFYTFRR